MSKEMVEVKPANGDRLHFLAGIMGFYILF